MGCVPSKAEGGGVAQKVELHPVKGGTEAVRSSTPSKRDAEEERVPQSSDSYIPPTLPASEEERLALLKALNILDTDRTDSKFKDITRLVCSAFNAPIAAVSLVDQDEFPGDTQWFKSAEGLGDVCETGRDVSFCGHTILPPTPQILIIEDALDDVRFAGNPLVCGPPRIRFYAGAPLVSSVSGHRYGSLCVIDTKPRRDLTPAHYNLLAQFAELAVREIERDKLTILQQMVAKQRAELSNMSSGVSTTISMRSDGSEAAGDDSGAIQGLTRAADCFVEGVLLVDVSQEPWPVRYANTAFTTTLGVPRDEAISQGFWELFGTRGDGCGKLSMQQIRDALAAGEPFSVAVSLQSIYTQTPKIVWFDFRPASTTQLHASAPGVPSFVQAQQGGAPSFGATPAEAEENGNASGGLITMYFAIADPKRRFSDLHMEPETTADAADAMMRRQNTAEARTVSEATARAMFGAATLPALPGVPNLQKSAPSAFEDVRLGPLIGRGAYGRVYRATWNGNTVAVKVMETTDAISEIRMSVVDDGGLKDGDSWKPHPAGTQGLFEALLSSSLSHPNIVHTYQYAVRPLAQAGTSSSGSSQANGLVEMKTVPRARAPNEVWIISEFCNRGPLLTAIERGAFLTQPSAQYGQPNLIAVLQTLQEVAAAMQYLHSHHIIHGDLTGGNVLLTSSDKDARGFTAKVVDFGLSRFCAREGGVKTKTMGCAEYMPPELITGGILTKACDVYAFGVIIWEIYVGKRAWEGMAPGAVLRKVASGETVVFPAQTPHRLRVLGEHCLAMQASQRPTFSQVLSEVNAILGDTMAILQQFLHATTASTGKAAS